MPIRNDAGTVGPARTAAASWLGYRPELSTVLTVLGGLAVSFLCATASYRYVEQPFLRRRRRHERLRATADVDPHQVLRDPAAVSALTSAYPSVPWGDYPPVVGERNVAASRTDAYVLDAAAPPRVWAVLLWGGFHTGDDDGGPFAQLLAEDYTQEHGVFGRHLKLALYERHFDFPDRETGPRMTT